MKQFVVGFIALFSMFNAHSASTHYGIASVGFSDFEFTNVENSGLAYSVAFGRQIHRQWYAEVGYLNLTMIAKMIPSFRVMRFTLLYLERRKASTGNCFIS